MPDTPTQVRRPTRPMLLQVEDIVPMSAREAAEEIEALRRAHRRIRPPHGKNEPG